jgi:mono/diheme cytochrome c family protein
MGRGSAVDLSKARAEAPAPLKEPSMKLPISICALSLPLGLLAAAQALGCSSSPSAPVTSANDASAPSTPTGGDDASSPRVDAGPLSFSADIYSAIIEHQCIGCHGPTADGGPGLGLAFGQLDMSSVDAGYLNLVNVESTGAACGSKDGGAAPIRVVPGSAATSLLYLKVDGFTTPPPCGHPMPESGEIPGGGQATVVQQIQTWIDQGALP